VAPPGRRCQNGGLQGDDSCVKLGIGLWGGSGTRSPGAGLLQGSTLLPGQRCCRSPALRAIGLRGRTVAGGVAARDGPFFRSMQGPGQ